MIVIYSNSTYYGTKWREIGPINKDMIAAVMKLYSVICEYLD